MHDAKWLPIMMMLIINATMTMRMMRMATKLMGTTTRMNMANKIIMVMRMIVLMTILKKMTMRMAIVICTVNDKTTMAKMMDGEINRLMGMMPRRVMPYRMSCSSHT